MCNKWFLRALATLGLGIGIAGPASAIVIDSVNDDFTINWALPNAGGSGVTVLGQAAFNITAVSDTSLAMTVTVNNLPDIGAPAGYKGGISSIGWATDPNATSGTLTPGSVFDGGAFTNIPSLTLVEVCIYAANNCAGGSQNQLLAENASDTFKITLNTSPDGSAIWNLTNFGMKFQTDNGSFEFYGCERDSCGNTVPEPGTLLLLGLGLLGCGVFTRRKI